MRETALRIDAALAEPVEEESQYGIREDRDSLRVEIKRLERERDEARAEVERLGRLLTDSTIIIRETVQILASVVRQINGEKP